MKQKNGKMKSRLLLLLALLLMVPVGVFAQNITVKGTVKDAGRDRYRGHCSGKR